MNSHVNDPTPDDTNFGLGDDYIVCKMSPQRLRQLESWLQERGLPPLQELQTPCGEICLAHDAETLDRFDRAHLLTPTEEEEPRTACLPEKEAKIPIVYCFPKEESH
jgi:hypothetical protein